MEITEQEYNELKQGTVEQAAKIDTMQDALNKALQKIEEVVKKPETKPEAKPETKPEAKPETKPADEDDKAAAELADLISGLQKKVQEFTSVGERVTQMEREKEALRIKSELDAAAAKYPLAEKKDVLTLFEEDPSKGIEHFASLLHAKNEQKLNEFKSKTEEEVKARLLKEKEGSISVPQSPGGPSTQNPANSDHPKSEDDLWGKALQESRQSWGKGV